MFSTIRSFWNGSPHVPVRSDETNAFRLLANKKDREAYPRRILSSNINVSRRSHQKQAGKSKIYAMFVLKVFRSLVFFSSVASFATGATVFFTCWGTWRPRCLTAGYLEKLSTKSRFGIPPNGFLGILSRRSQILTDLGYKHFSPPIQKLSLNVNSLYFFKTKKKKKKRKNTNKIFQASKIIQNR